MGNESLFMESGSRDQDGWHAHIWLKSLKIISETERPINLKPGMHHSVLRLYQSCSNGDSLLTLTYFMARLMLVTLLLYRKKGKTGFM